MSHSKIEEPSFFLELERTIKSLLAFEGKQKTEDLKALFEELKKSDREHDSRSSIDGRLG